MTLESRDYLRIEGTIDAYWCPSCDLPAMQVEEQEFVWVKGKELEYAKLVCVDCGHVEEFAGFTEDVDEKIEEYRGEELILNDRR